MSFNFLKLLDVCYLGSVMQKKGFLIFNKGQKHMGLMSKLNGRQVWKQNCRQYNVLYFGLL